RVTILIPGLILWRGQFVAANGGDRMMKSSAQRCVGFAVGAMISMFAQPASAQQSVLDDVDECDSLAAHPSDPERLADGVADDAIVPKLAVAACEAAVKRSPE